MNKFLKSSFFILLISVVVGCDSKTDPIEPYTIGKDETIHKSVTELPNEFTKYKARFEASKTQFIRVDVEPQRNIAPWESKLRGKPYWPKDMEYPADVTGEPLQLLAQINFHDVPQGFGYPSAGILQFFIHPGVSDNHVWGMTFYDETPYVAQDAFKTLQTQDYFRIVFHQNATRDENKLRKSFPSHGDNVMPVIGQAALHFSVDEELVTPEDYQFEDKLGVSVQQFYDEHNDLPYEVFDDLYMFLATDAPMKMNGYGRFVQGDPREALQNADDWVVLLNFESFVKGDVDSMWGDGGTATFFIEKQRLAIKDFSSVAYYWDNH